VAFDAVLLVSFGGPEGPDDVMPFLQNVVEGRNVPPQRLEAVAAQYHLFGGISPINDLNRALTVSLQNALARRGRDLPVYWGNRNWAPYLSDVVAGMASDGVRAAAAVLTSAYSSYSGCRQYLEDIDVARAAAGWKAPRIVKVQPYYDRDGFVEPFTDGLREARRAVGSDAPVIMTAHSIPVTQAALCAYESQLSQVAERVAAAAAPAGGGPAPPWTGAIPSRSGPPSQPWLEPAIGDVIRSLPEGTRDAIAVPIGFVSDHMEVVYDLDVVAASQAAQRGTRLVRVPTPGTDPRFAEMLADLVCETEELDASGKPPGPCCGPGCCTAGGSAAV
jgi:ferrochelatase